MWMHYGYGGGIGWGFPSLFWILFIVFLAGFILVLLGSHDERDKSRSEENDSREPEEDTAIEILRERYAKGEITKRQFQDMKRDLL
ncbi:SHOCT domain-containing protein [Patescibacteria group bacterium]|nr:SHOCT domain-containing protein [Patescibacteria group bacterium]MCL5797842.1 SHOCT domain-containing protein [Patescibacteria group bacterium]